MAFWRSSMCARGQRRVMGVREGLCLLWSVMVCQWSRRMLLGLFAVNEEKGQEEAPWEPKKILWGVGHDASPVHTDSLALRLSMTPVKREMGRDLFVNTLFNWVRSSLVGGRFKLLDATCGLLWFCLSRDVATHDAPYAGHLCDS